MMLTQTMRCSLLARGAVDASAGGRRPPRRYHRCGHEMALPFTVQLAVEEAIYSDRNSSQSVTELSPTQGQSGTGAGALAYAGRRRCLQPAGRCSRSTEHGTLQFVARRERSAGTMLLFEIPTRNFTKTSWFTGDFGEVGG